MVVCWPKQATIPSGSQIETHLVNIRDVGRFATLYESLIKL